MDRLMSDIIRQKQLPQEEHQAWKRIGKAICNNVFDINIRNLVSLYDSENEEYENFSDTERLGCKFLRIIDRRNESTNDQEFAHQLLIILHKVALNIL